MSDKNNTDNRIKVHPVLEVMTKKAIHFTFNGIDMEAKEGEVISSALFANGISEFGKHSNDGSPQGIFCANGQCSQCTVIADGNAVKSCMTSVEDGMIIESLIGIPKLNDVIDKSKIKFDEIEEVDTPVLIIGGGPSGLNAAIELGKQCICNIFNPVRGADLIRKLAAV